MTKRTFLILLFLLPMLTVSTARFAVPRLVLRSWDSERMVALSRYIDANWQPGDVIYHVGDGSWMEMVNYSAHVDAFYKMPLCGNVRGALSFLTRQGLGVQSSTLDQLHWSRAWIITAVSPMTPQCEQYVIGRYLKGVPELACVNNNVLLKDCLYLVTHE